MALFFDAAWFDAALAERGLSRAVLAAAAGLTEPELDLVYKDQRELSPREVAAFGEVLGVGAAEIARQAGVSTPTPRHEEPTRLDRLEARVAALEAQIARLSARRDED
jgi:uncharacterized protein YceH (UPF0502 family)